MNDYLEKNRTAYGELKEELEAEYPGQVALLTTENSWMSTKTVARPTQSVVSNFGLGKFYTQNIGEGPISLGIFTLCLPKSA